MKKNILLILMAIAGISYSAIAQKPAIVTNDKPGWHKIAQTVVDLKSDKDEVEVLGDDHFKALQLHVEDAPVEMTDLSVIYGNDEHEDITVKDLINAGGQTRQIDLEGKDRSIKKVILRYKTVPNAEHDKARVEIWGLK
jgi:hypothetical protein